jgi:protoporphyrinogen oxidase
MGRAEPIIVIGSGPAGLGAGLALGDEGVVLEESARPGGLCSTIEFEGAVFDWGGHSFHTPHPEVRELVFGALEMYEQPRRAYCWSNGTLIPYPFQAHFRELPDRAVVEECARGLADVSPNVPARDFGEYLLGRFGDGIARHFLLPYNRKLWGGDLTRLAADWAAERVAALAGSGQVFAVSGGRRTPLRCDTIVAYPARGGFAEITTALGRRLPDLRLGQGVRRIDPLRRELVTSRGDVLRWRGLVSTLALDRLLSLLPDVPPPVALAARALEALPLALVLVVCDHPVDTPVQRVYCAGPEIPAHKIVLNHNSSPYLRSLPRHGIQAEVARPDPADLAGGALERQVVRGLCALGLVRSPAVVRATRALFVPRAYPVPTAGRDEAVRLITGWLAARDIFCAGRFAEWAYINADEAIHRGLTLGARLLGRTEPAVRPRVA